MKRIAIIPARSGSKGVKNKNILPICGKPLLAYAIEAALQSDLFDRVILSSNSEEYGEIGRAYGAEFIKRSEETASDKASTFVVIKELFEQIEMDFDYFMLLPPTSPLRTAQHVCEAAALYEKRAKEYDFLVSMCACRHPASLVRPIDGDGSLKYFDEDFSNFRRQDFKYYSPNGAIYIGKPQAYLERKHFYGAKALAYVMDDISSADVDGPVDYELVNLLMEKRLKGLL